MMLPHSSWGVQVNQRPEGGRWFIFLSASTPAHINQSQTPLFRKGMGESEQERKLQGAWEREGGLLPFSKGCEQVATPSGLQLEHRNSAAPSLQSSCSEHIAIYCLPFYHPTDGWRDKSCDLGCSSQGLPQPIRCLHLTLPSSSFHAQTNFTPSLNTPTKNLSWNHFHSFSIWFKV